MTKDELVKKTHILREEISILKFYRGKEPDKDLIKEKTKEYYTYFKELCNITRPEGLVEIQKQPQKRTTKKTRNCKKDNK